MGETDVGWIIKANGRLLPYTLRASRSSAVAYYTWNVDDELSKDPRNNTCWGTLSPAQRAGWQRVRKRDNAKAVKVYLTRAEDSE